MPMVLKLRHSYPTHKAAIEALVAEIARLSTEEFDDRHVPGSILAAFDQHWPDGLCWADQGLWGEEGPDESAIYDIRDVEMDWDEGGHDFLGELVHEYWKEHIRES